MAIIRNEIDENCEIPLTEQQDMTNNNASNRARTIALTLAGFGLLILGGLAMLSLSRAGSAGSIDDISSYPPITPRTVEFPAPQLSLKDANGNPVNLTDFGGKVVLVNNWAIWCAPCRAELPELEAYYKTHKGEAFTIVGIEAGSEKEDVINHIEKFGLSFPIWLDPNLEGVKAFQNRGLPNSYVIDGNGIVRLAWSGATTRQMLEEYVTPLIKGQ
jgi:cytochrome c biogenesis protein CcmG, thiol:disulfide interchange protein DsbE